MGVANRQKQRREYLKKKAKSVVGRLSLVSLLLASSLLGAFMLQQGWIVVFAVIVFLGGLHSEPAQAGFVFQNGASSPWQQISIHTLKAYKL